MSQDFTLFAVVQNGRLAYEALLLAASLARSNPDLTLTLAEPQPGPLWEDDPRIDADIRAMLLELGAKIVPFESKVFGASYPHGNKIEALSVLPKGKPFLFLDTDTLVLGDLAGVPFDFDRPTASLRREGTWPKGENIGAVWRSLYDRFGLDFESSLDLSYPGDDWRRYLYFNAGFFFGRDPVAFGALFLEMAKSVRDDPPKALDGQKLTPWLDQIVLPLVIHKLGGGRDTLPDGLMDGKVTCHYRTLSLLYAREGAEVVSVLEELAAPNRIKKLLKPYEPARKLIYQGGGEAIGHLFASGVSGDEMEVRKRLKAAGLWFR